MAVNLRPDEIEVVTGPMVQVLLAGEANERLVAFSDLVLPDVADDPATISDTDLLARVARYYDMQPDVLEGYKVSRPQTGHIVVLQEPLYG